MVSFFCRPALEGDCILRAPTHPGVSSSWGADQAPLSVSAGSLVQPSTPPNSILPLPGPRRSVFLPWCPVSVFHPANLISTMLVLPAGDTEKQDLALLASGSSPSPREVEGCTRQWNKAVHGGEGWGWAAVKAWRFSSPQLRSPPSAVLSSPHGLFLHKLS